MRRPAFFWICLSAPPIMMYMHYHCAICPFTPGCRSTSPSRGVLMPWRPPRGAGRCADLRRRPTPLRVDQRPVHYSCGGGRQSSLANAGAAPPAGYGSHDIEPHSQAAERKWIIGNFRRTWPAGRAHRPDGGRWAGASPSGARVASGPSCGVTAPGARTRGSISEDSQRRHGRRDPGIVHIHLFLRYTPYTREVST